MLPLMLADDDNYTSHLQVYRKSQTTQIILFLLSVKQSQQKSNT